MDLYIDFPIRLHGVVLNLLSTGTTYFYQGNLLGRGLLINNYKTRNNVPMKTKLGKSVQCTCGDNLAMKLVSLSFETQTDTTLSSLMLHV
jgi:hypothetical protein